MTAVKRILHYSAAIATGGVIGYGIAHPGFAGFSFMWDPGWIFLGFVMFASISYGLIRWPVRAVVGIHMMLLFMLGLWLLFRVHYSLEWGDLGKMYEKLRRATAEDLPWIVRVLLPFTPLAWWCWFTPLLAGITAAVRMRGEPTLGSLVTKSLLLVLLLVMAYGVIVTYALPLSYMGLPDVEEMNGANLLCNLALLVTGVAVVIRSVQVRKNGKDTDQG